MPELPEVETVLQKIQPLIKGRHVRDIIIRKRELRWKIPDELQTQFPHHRIDKIQRRGKYLIFHTKNGNAILHFGMSGSLAIVPLGTPPKKHDHFDLIFDTFCLRYTDPRRFGALLWTQKNPLSHPLLAHLGPEPLSDAFNEQYLYSLAKNRSVSIKQFIMNSTIVVGVGNIYAAEALYMAKIHPLTKVKKLEIVQFKQLVSSIRKVLKAAINQGGTTLRDFSSPEGKLGYFKQKLCVYGREHLPCKRCGTILEKIQIQNRATVFCPHCQVVIV